MIEALNIRNVFYFNFSNDFLSSLFSLLKLSVGDELIFRGDVRWFQLAIKKFILNQKNYKFDFKTVLAKCLKETMQFVLMHTPVLECKHMHISNHLADLPNQSFRTMG